MKNGVSVVVPTYNEEENIRPLVLEIHKALKSNYEVIFIDDHSTDKTVEEITKLEENFPIRLFIKKGQKGKTFSLLEGFEKAKYPYIAMIDADLQYPPSAIPEMLQQLKKDEAHISASYRKKYNAPINRKVQTMFTRTFISRALKLPHDIQSGLKVFDRKVLKDVKLSTQNGWTFDLEFLAKSKKKGYKIVNHDITFEPRIKGESKISLREQVGIVKETWKLRKELS